MRPVDASNVMIRAATPADALRLSLVSSATFLETFAGMIDGDALVRHCETVHDPGGLAAAMQAGALAWLAEVDGAPVGYAMLTTPALDAAQDGDIELKKIYLQSRFHGGDTAARLLASTIDGAAGHSRLLLGVKDDNHRAIGFYRKHGFGQIATRRFDVGGTLYDDVVLARDLEQV